MVGMVWGLVLLYGSKCIVYFYGTLHFHFKYVVGRFL